MAQTRDNIGVHRALRTLLNKEKRTVKDVSKVFRLGKTRTYELMRNPNLMTLERIYSLSGYLSINCLELFACIHLNKSKLDNKELQTLAELSEKYK